MSRKSDSTWQRIHTLQTTIPGEEVKPDFKDVLVILFKIFRFQHEIRKHIKNLECIFHTLEEKKSVETVEKETRMFDFLNKNIKLSTLNMTTSGNHI